MKLPHASRPRYTWLVQRVLRIFFIFIGTLSVGLGVLGIFLPMLPTTPFLLLAAVCFARSSPRLLHWLNHNKWFGVYIRRYREGLGIPLREKYLTIVLLWLTIGVSIVFFVPLLWVKILLVAIALAVTVHLVRIRTYRADDDGKCCAGGEVKSEGVGMEAPRPSD